MGKVDARVLRTKHDLREGLLSLLKKKPLEKITVKGICDYTKINKMTFYKHYKDKYDLLDDCINEIASDIASTLSLWERLKTKANLPIIYTETCIAAIDSCLEHREELLSISSCSNSLGLDVVQAAVRKLFQKYLENLSFFHTFHLNKENLSDFLSGGFSTFVMSTVRKGSYNKEEFSASLNKLLTVLFEADVI